MVRLFRLLITWVLVAGITTGCAVPRPSLPERTVPVSEEAASRFEEKLAQLRRLTNGEVRLTFTESELTSYLRVRLLHNQPSVEPTVWFTGGLAVVDVSVNLPSMPSRLHLVATLIGLAEDGQIHILARHLTIDGISVPPPLLQRFSRLASRSLNNAIAPVQVRDLQILEEEVSVVLSR